MADVTTIVSVVGALTLIAFTIVMLHLTYVSMQDDAPADDSASADGG